MQLVQVAVIINGVMAQAATVIEIHDLQQQCPELANFFFLLTNNLLPVVMLVLTGLWHCISLSNRIIGTATESLIRTLSESKQDGLIDVSGGGIRVLLPNKLRRSNW